MVSEEKRFIDSIKRELDQQVAAQSPSLHGRLRAVRRDALAGRSDSPSRRFLLPGVVSALLMIVVSTVIWFQGIERSEAPLETMLQAATVTDLQLLNDTDEMEFYRDLEFYYWLEQVLNHAG